MKIPTFLFLTVATWLGMCASAPTAKCADPATVTVIPNLAYKDGVALNPYESERCRLDLYVPAGAKDVPCLLWFHGGALVEGSKSDPGTAATCRALASEGILVASAEYRFSPTVKYPAYHPGRRRRRGVDAPARHGTRRRPGPTVRERALGGRLPDGHAGAG